VRSRNARRWLSGSAFAGASGRAEGNATTCRARQRRVGNTTRRLPRRRRADWRDGGLESVARERTSRACRVRDARRTAIAARVWASHSRRWSLTKVCLATCGCRYQGINPAALAARVIPPDEHTLSRTRNRALCGALTYDLRRCNMGPAHGSLVQAARPAVDDRCEARLGATTLIFRLSAHGTESPSALARRCLRRRVQTLHAWSSAIVGVEVDQCGLGGTGDGPRSATHALLLCIAHTAHSALAGRTAFDMRQLARVHSRWSWRWCWRWRWQEQELLAWAMTASVARAGAGPQSSPSSGAKNLGLGKLPSATLSRPHPTRHHRAIAPSRPPSHIHCALLNPASQAPSWTRTSTGACRRSHANCAPVSRPPSSASCRTAWRRSR
jgi:hypothetical protein